MAIMIAEPPKSRSLGVGFSSNRSRTGNPEAWKQNIGSKQVPARLALLPDAKPNWHRVGFSAAVQLAILGFFLIVPMLYPEQIENRHSIFVHRHRPTGHNDSCCANTTSSAAAEGESGCTQANATTA